MWKLIKKFPTRNQLHTPGRGASESKQGLLDRHLKWVRHRCAQEWHQIQKDSYTWELVWVNVKQKTRLNRITKNYVCHMECRNTHSRKERTNLHYDQKEG